MENEIQGIKSTVEGASVVMRRISALCDMLSGLGDTESNIPVESLSDTLFLIRDMLAEQAGALEALHWPVKRTAAA